MTKETRKRMNRAANRAIDAVSSIGATAFLAGAQGVWKPDVLMPIIETICDYWRKCEAAVEAAESAAEGKS